MHRHLTSLALLFSVVCLGLSAMEMGVARFAPQPLVRAYGIAHPDLGTWQRPSVTFHDTTDGDYWVRANAQAFRMDEDADLSPGRRRVIIYGDSFVLGWGVNIEQAFFSLLKQSLEGRDPSLQLLNSGAGGYSTGHVKKLAEAHLAGLRPAAAVYFFNNNDIIENAITDLDYRVTDYAFAPDGTVTLTDRQPFTPWKRFLLNHTPYGWLNQHSHLFVLGKDELARLSAAHLDRLATVLENAGVPLVVVWIPSWDEIAGQGDAVKLELMARSVAALKEVAARRGFAFIDPDTLMAADSLRLPDGHFNVAGNRWFAELIEPALAQSLSRALGRDR
ncbi:SGNH/GDSL hydrolase family protein [Magnetospirillum sp. 15-1]|uniref:SGNH/GDSL hydrolase family protein n=1 Tax=Magnetospirillum sp. 15-1 TaxID=1979370 RepID=UPI001482C58F|nr:SGNH/GDSL hydrolase family protein [Magnetospirillum sp. 15-1]